ncbi:hypothetical protein HYZ99_02135 [Candidatus Peregrinibacteria bacterium]|nr:hypothetical protein [Candidatus Peregrinibacteria bacterium]
MTSAISGDTTGATIPPETQAKFGALVALILGSESMNTEERQYWINILPIMTAEQTAELQGILENEKAQLAAIDQKYAKETAQMGQAEQIAKTDAERTRKRSARKETEGAHREAEEQSAEDLLKKIEE